VDLVNSVPAAWQVSVETKQVIGRLPIEGARLLADSSESIYVEASRLPFRPFLVK
jgi:hypothetical protein